MTPHDGGIVSGGEMRWVVAGCGRHRRRHIEAVCSLANAYSKSSVLDLLPIHTRVQASRCPTLPSLTSVARVANGWTEEGGARGSANAVAEGGNTFAKKKVETMQNYPHALINRKERHPGIVLVCNGTKERKI